MNKRARRMFAGFVLVLAALLLFGCSSDKGADNGQPEEGADLPIIPADPVTVTLFPWNPFPSNEVDLFIQQHLNEKYPHITVELLDLPRTDLQNLIVAGNPPDLIAAAASFLSTFADMDLIEDIKPYVEKHNIDLNRLDPIFFEHNLLYNDSSMYGLPYSVPFGAMYYNKDIFDKFGVEYPSDGLTWDDTIELARLLTRTEDGVSYKGFVVDVNRVLLTLGQPFIDPATHEAAISRNPLFRNAYSIYQRIVTMPGNEQRGGRVAIFLRGEAAMMAHIQQFNANFENATNQGLNWDVGQYPSHEEPRNTYLDYNPHIMIPTKTSKNKDAAVQVLDVLTSEPAQMNVSRQGHLTSLRNPAILQVFGENLPYLEGKSVQSIFKSRPSPPIIRTEYNSLADPFVFNEAAAALENGVDVNTVMRETDEKINQAIRQAKSQ